jgi:hypothetical protein
MPGTEWKVEPGEIIHVSSQNCSVVAWEKEDGTFGPWGFGYAYVIQVDDGIVWVRHSYGIPQAMPR